LFYSSEISFDHLFTNLRCTGATTTFIVNLSDNNICGSLSFCTIFSRLFIKSSSRQDLHPKIPSRFLTHTYTPPIRANTTLLSRTDYQLPHHGLLQALLDSGLRSLRSRTHGDVFPSAITIQVQSKCRLWQDGLLHDLPTLRLWLKLSLQVIPV
jgi:hypothetical protein